MENVEKKIEIEIVGKRCVYINDYRVAGSKPYASENLPQYAFTATISDILDAFSLPEIINYLAATGTDRIRAALEARGLEIREKNDD